MKKALTIFLAVALVVLFVGISTDYAKDQKGKKKGNGNVIVVPYDFPTIQGAIEEASDGSVIMVMDGIYKEQIEIRDLEGFRIVSNNATITVPIEGMTGQLVKIYNCQNFHFTGFTVDGNYGEGVSYGLRNSGGDSDTRFYGIFVINSSGHIVKNTVQNVSWGNGVQQGLGINVIVDNNIFQKINIQENSITNFQKNGITISGPVQAKINKNVVTGWGDTNTIAQNCIQLGYDPNMTASVTQNIISDSNYTPMTWASTGILAIAGNNNIRFINNTISDTMIGIFVYPGSTNCKIINNKGSGNIWDFYSFEDDTKVHANKFLD